MHHDMTDRNETPLDRTRQDQTRRSGTQGSGDDLAHLHEHEHTTRLSRGGFVVCACGWATAAADRDPREAAAAHIAATAPPGTMPSWVERPGGRVCVPGDLAR